MDDSNTANFLTYTVSDEAIEAAGALREGWGQFPMRH
jgi:hypothetical protein